MRAVFESSSAQSRSLSLGKQKPLKRRTALPLRPPMPSQFARPRLMLLLIVVVALTAIFLYACGGEKPRVTSDTAETDTVEAALRSATPEQEITTEAAAHASPAPAESATKGGALRIAQREPITLDPALVVDPFSAMYITEMFGGLVMFDLDLHLAPDLAEEIPQPTVNQDGTVTYRFVLRENAVFQDGRRVTAEDVRWSFKRALAPTTLSPTAAGFLGDIQGAQEYALGRADEITGLDVIDERTIEITTTGPVAVFVAKLAFPAAFVVDRAEIESDPTGWAREPNGTGPFRLKEWRQGDQIVLERFDAYHLEPARADTVQIRFVPAGVTQYEAEEFDIVAVESGALAQVQDPTSPLHTQFMTTPSLFWLWVGFNTTQPPFDDPWVRQAFGMAIDKQSLAEALQGAATAAEGFLAPGMAGYDPEFRGLPFDPEMARQILAGSRYADRPALMNIVLTVPAGGATPSFIIDAIIEMWRQNLGITVEVDALDPATFAATLGERQCQAFVATSGPGFPDPSEVLAVYFYSPSIRNFTGYSNPEVDRLLERAQAEFNTDARISLYQAAQRMIVDDAPGLPLLHPQISQLVKPYVRGYRPPQMFVPYLRYISLEP